MWLSLEEKLTSMQHIKQLYPQFNYWEISFLASTIKSYSEAWIMSYLSESTKKSIEKLINRDVAKGKNERWIVNFDSVKVEIDRATRSLIVTPVYENSNQQP